jgi:lipid-A-disaccharide synthase
MEAAGCKLLANPVKRSAMLVGALLTETRYWWKLLRQIRAELEKTKPAVVVPIDSSFINLRIAQAAKQLGFPVCYYVAPQVWASRPWRVKKIKTCVDTLCCILPFEEKYFQDRGVNAVYVGHPMFDVPVQEDMAQLQPPLPGLASSGGDGPRVAIFPGSRRAEINAHMPAMLRIMAHIKGRFGGVNFVAAAPSEERAWQIRHHLKTSNVAVDIRVGHGDALIQWADLVLTKSGTATLQVARQAKPMVVMFHVPWWQWNVARHLILTQHIALVNILAGRAVVPEFIPFYGSPRPVAEECVALLADADRRQHMMAQLQEVVAPLQPREGQLAADRVAQEVIHHIGGRAGAVGTLTC